MARSKEMYDPKGPGGKGETQVGRFNPCDIVMAPNSPAGTNTSKAKGQGGLGQQAPVKRGTNTGQTMGSATRVGPKNPSGSSRGAVDPQGKQGMAAPKGSVTPRMPGDLSANVPKGRTVSHPSIASTNVPGTGSKVDQVARQVADGLGLRK